MSLRSCEAQGTARTYEEEVTLITCVSKAMYKNRAIWEKCLIGALLEWCFISDNYGIGLLTLWSLLQCCSSSESA